MELHSVERNKCIGDWLEYTLPGQTWGTGVRMCNSSAMNQTHILEDNIELHFRGDSDVESRGFWIKYEGKKKKEKKKKKILFTCHSYYTIGVLL